MWMIFPRQFFQITWCSAQSIQCVSTNLCTCSRWAISQEWMSVLHVSCDQLCAAFLWPCKTFCLVQKVMSPRLVFFLITYLGIDTTSLLLLSTSFQVRDVLKHLPRVLQTMPASQYKLQSWHCCFDDASQSSKISVLLMSAMRSCDSLLNSLISFLCLKSFRKDSLFGWFSNFSINCLTLSLRCVSYCSTAERGTPGIR